MIKIKPKSPSSFDSPRKSPAKEKILKENEQKEEVKQNTNQNENESFTNNNNSTKSTPKKSPKFGYKKKTQELWDEDGVLLQRDFLNQKSPKSGEKSLIPRKKKSKMGKSDSPSRLDPLSKPENSRESTPKKKETDYEDSFILNPKQEEKKSTPLKLKQFIQNNEEAHLKRQRYIEEKQEEERQLSNMRYLSKKSAEIVEKSKKKKNIFDVDMTYHKNDPTYDAQYEEQETTPNKKRIRPTKVYEEQIKYYEELQTSRESQKLIHDQELTMECTFHPHLYNDPKDWKKVVQNARDISVQEINYEEEFGIKEPPKEEPRTPTPKKPGSISKPVQNVIDAMKEFFVPLEDEEISSPSKSKTNSPSSVGNKDSQIGEEEEKNEYHTYDNENKEEEEQNQ